MNNLKFENTAKIGDEIKAYDFDPARVKGETFVQGVVIDKGDFDRGYMCYQIKLTNRFINDKDVTNTEDEKIWYIPYQVDLFEFDNRVQKIN